MAAGWDWQRARHRSRDPGQIFVSYPEGQQQTASWLADELSSAGLRVFARCRDLEPGDLVVHRVERELGRAATGLLLIGVDAPLSPGQYHEYAAMLTMADRRELRLIPVLLGDATIDVTPLASGTAWVDLRSLDATAMRAQVRELAAGIATSDTSAAAVYSPRFVIIHALSGLSADYSGRLREQLRQDGLPTWSVDDLRPGSAWVNEMRTRIECSLGLLVLMAPEAEGDDGLTRQILHGQWHNRSFLPILLAGAPLFLLGSTWYYDAQDGRLLADAELDHLRGLAARRTGGVSSSSDIVVAPRGESAWTAPRPFTIPGPTTARRRANGVGHHRPRALPHGDRLAQLEQLLRDGDTVPADLMTTSILLAAAGRSSEGYLRPADRGELDRQVLSDVDRIWAQATDGRHGLTSQRSRYRFVGEHGRDFRVAAQAFGWHDGGSGRGYGAPIPRYSEFIEQRLMSIPDTFFPTLRNPQVENRPAWYDRWVKTVLAVHTRYRGRDET